MFTPILGRVSVQYDCSSPGAWAQHTDKLLNTITTPTRHLILTPTNDFSSVFITGQTIPLKCWADEYRNQLPLQDLRSGSTSKSRNFEYEILLVTNELLLVNTTTSARTRKLDVERTRGYMGSHGTDPGTDLES